MKYIKVKDAEELVRDVNSSAILNTDNSGLAQYKTRKQKEAMVDRIIQEQIELRKEVGEIKDILKQLIGQK
jgi:hypothetical protein